MIQSTPSNKQGSHPDAVTAGGRILEPRKGNIRAMNSMDSTMLLIGRMPQYFFDNAILEQIQDVMKTFHSPVKEPGPIIQKDRPWERVPYFTVNGSTVVRDTATGEFKCWYEDWQIDPSAVDPEAATPDRDRPNLGVITSRLCYARSDDGRNWEKPALDYLEKDGCKTNVVLGCDEYQRSESSSVFDDPLETDPQRRFKSFHGHYAPDGHVVTVAYSPDGIHWTPSEERPTFGNLGEGLGDVYTVIADLDSRSYRCTCRHKGILAVYHDKRRPRTPSVFFHPTYPRDAARANKRRIFQGTSTDLIHWSNPQCILTPDEDIDNLDETYYGMVQVRMGQGYLGFLNTIREVPNTLSVRLVYSRDGWHWFHLNKRQPWLVCGEDSWDRCMVNVSSPPIPVGDELYVYYGGARNHHDWWVSGLKEKLDVPEAHSLDEVGYGLGLARMRRDGFVSVDAGPVREGVVITRVLRTDGRQLVLNAKCRDGGYIRVEATDGDENVLEGCGREMCSTFTGDSTRAVVTWGRQGRIPHDGKVRLRFFMRGASLYSIQFTDPGDH